MIRPGRLQHAGRRDPAYPVMCPFLLIIALRDHNPSTLQIDGRMDGLEVYGNTYPSYLDKLTILNNKLLRILQKKDALVVMKVYICSTILCLVHSCSITMS